MKRRCTLSDSGLWISVCCQYLSTWATDQKNKHRFGIPRLSSPLLLSWPLEFLQTLIIAMWGTRQASAAVATDLAARWQQGEQREGVCCSLVGWLVRQADNDNQSEWVLDEWRHTTRWRVEYQGKYFTFIEWNTKSYINYICVCTTNNGPSWWYLM